MRFKQFITEGAFDLQKFLNDTYHFRSQLPEQTIDAPYRGLWRGVNEKHALDNGWKIYSRTRDRSPRDTPFHAHDVMDEALFDIFNWHVRRVGVFCTSYINEAGGYGSAFIIFPIGKFAFIWSPDVKDAFSDLWEKFAKANNAPRSSELSAENEKKWNEELRPAFRRYVEAFDWYDTNLKGAIKHRGEVIIDCDQYYAFDPTSELWKETIFPNLCE